MNIEELLAIKVRITDRAALERLAPEQVTAYFEARPAYQKDTKTLQAFGTYYLITFFVPEDGQIPSAILVPHTRTMDYALRISEAIQDIARAEQRSELAVYADIADSQGRMA